MAISDRFGFCANTKPIHPISRAIEKFVLTIYTQHRFIFQTNTMVFHHLFT